MSGSRRTTKSKLEPLPDLSDDDLETVLDIKGKSNAGGSLIVLIQCRFQKVDLHQQE